MSNLPKYLSILIVIAFTFLNDNSNAYINLSMKYKIIPDTASMKYLPLAVGNVYKYHYASSNFFSYDYAVRIIKDTLIDSKRYFVLNRLFPGYIGEIIRLDSGTSNYYTRSGSGYCLYSQYEELQDSLSARKNDTTHVCAYSVSMHICSDTGFTPLFGNQVSTKTFTRNTSDVSSSVTYGRNFGIIASFYSDFWGMAGESLTGCFINGVLYGDTTVTNVNVINSELPSCFNILQNYPNPFNQSTIINVQCSMRERVVLKVYDITGREVQTILDEVMNPGVYRVRFDGEGLTSGIYFYRMRAGSYVETRKMVFLK